MKTIQISIFTLLAAFMLTALGTAQTATGARDPDQPQYTATRRITLDEAKALAASKAVDNPMVRLAQLNAQVATLKRKEAQADYLPKVGGTFANLHFNKFMGERLQIVNRSLAVPLFDKDPTIFAATVIQPLTPMLKVNQAVKIMRADEVIAKTKADAAAAGVAANVEKAYYELLIKQRQMIGATAKVREVERQLNVASIDPVISGSDLADQAAALLAATKKSMEMKGSEMELAAALNNLLGLPADTHLDLVTPAAALNADQRITLGEAMESAASVNPAVIEAEQNVVKAKAAKKLSQLEYVPDVAIVGGYSNQTLMPLLPRDFTFVGVMATYNIFDFGKREKLIKERKTTLEMAEIALELAKGASRAEVTKSYFEVERTSKLLELTRRAVTAQEMVRASSGPSNANETVIKADAEASVLAAELEYRLAYAELMRLTGR